VRWVDSIAKALEDSSHANGSRLSERTGKSTHLNRQVKVFAKVLDALIRQVEVEVAPCELRLDEAAGVERLQGATEKSQRGTDFSRKNERRQPSEKYKR
jgi:hypothetical protein